MENDFLTIEQSELLIKKANTLKHKVMIIIMLDAGLRVTEMLRLKFQDIDFKRQVLKVKSLKKRGKDQVREIPLTERANEFLIAWVNHERPSNTNTPIFGNITRQAVNIMLKRLQEQPELNHVNLYPHKLRHSFGTNLRATGAELEDIKDLLGHKNIQTTTIYTHAKPEILKARIEATQAKKPFFKRLFDGLKPKPRPYFLSVTDKTVFLGREKEVTKIVDLLSKNVNVLLLGEAGSGKTHLIDNLKFDRQVLRIESTENFKLTLKNLILFLFQNDKEALKVALYGELDLKAIEVKLNKETTQELCNLIRSITKPYEYILLIDSVDSITPKTAKCLEILKDQFAILATARGVKVNNSSFLWNFEKVELKALTRAEGLKLVYKWCVGTKPEIATKIVETAQGNPRMLYELCDRLNKEQATDLQDVEHIFNGYLGKESKEFDVSLLLMIALAVIASFKYFASEMDAPELKIIGGLALILLILGRFIFQRVKRQYI
jgi:integrase/recombinase XerD